MKRLVVTADDFGLCPGVVAGVARAHEHGIVTSTSLMVNGPAAEAAFAAARRLPSLAVGLHFVLTFGRPLGPPEPLARLLDEAGAFLRNGSGAQERATADEVREELRAQLRALELGIGRPPSHIDGHHHAHLQEGPLAAVLEQARRLGVPVRSTEARTRARLRREGVRTCDEFLPRFYGEKNVSEAKLLELLRHLPQGTTELMCHPAEEDEVLSSLSGYVGPRYEELRTLVSPRIVEAVRELSIELCPMSVVE